MEASTFGYKIETYYFDGYIEAVKVIAYDTSRTSDVKNIVPLKPLVLRLFCMRNWGARFRPSFYCSAARC